MEVCVCEQVLTLIYHRCDRRRSRKTHCWLNKLSEYDYLSYNNKDFCGDQIYRAKKQINDRKMCNNNIQIDSPLLFELSS